MGDLVESDCWADTMADHLEEVQWRVRPLGAVEGDRLGPELPVNIQPFSSKEVEQVVKQLRKCKASGRDGIPAEYWQAATSSAEGLAWLTDFCNRYIHTYIHINKHSKNTHIYIYTYV